METIEKQSFGSTSDIASAGLRTVIQSIPYEKLGRINHRLRRLSPGTDPGRYSLFPSITRELSCGGSTIPVGIPASTEILTERLFV